MAAKQFGHGERKTTWGLIDISIIGGAVLASVTLLPGSAMADSLTWDPANDAPNPPTSGTGTWDNGLTTAWNNGGVSDVFENGLDDVTFGTIAGTVTVSGTVQATALTFNVDGFTVSGGNIDVGTSPTVTVGTTTTTISSDFVGTGNLTFAGQSTGLLTLSGPASNITGSVEFTGGTGFSVLQTQSISASAGLTNAAALTNSGTINGDLTTSGNFTNTSSLNGALNATGGITTVGGAGTVTGAVDVAQNTTFINDGDLTSTADGTTDFALDSEGNTINNGAVTGAVRVTGGFFSNTGDLLGDLTTTGGAISLGSGGQIFGLTTIGSDGVVTNAGRIGDLTSAGNLTNSSLIEGDVTVTGGQLTNSNIIGFADVNDKLTVTGGVVQNSDEIDMDVVVSNTGSIVSSGVDALFRLDIEMTGGTFTNGAGSSVLGTVSVSDGTFTNTGKATDDVSGDAGLSGDVEVSSNGVFTNSGDIYQNLTVTGGTATNAVGGTIAGTVAVSGTGTFVNEGTASGDVGVTGGTFNNAATVSGNVQSAGSSDNTGDIVGNVTVTDSVFVNQASGMLATGVGSTVTVQGGTLTNNGTISGDANVTGTGTLTSIGTISADVTNAGTFNGQGDLNGNLTNTGTAAITGPGLNVTGAVSQNAGTLEVQADSVLRSDSIATVGGSVIDVQSGGRAISLGTMALSNAGTLNLAENATVQAASGITNTSTGDIQVTGNGVAANLDAGAGTIANAGMITLNAGDLIFSGDVINSGTVTFSGGDVDSFDSFTNSTAASSLDITQGTVFFGGVTNTAGAITIGGTGTLNSALTISGGTVTSNSAIVGDVDNAGTFVANGTLTGDFTNTGTATINGAGMSGIESLRAENGTLAVGNGATLSANDIVFSNNASVSVGDNATLSGLGSRFINEGSLSVGSGGTINNPNDIFNSSGALLSFAGTAGTVAQVDSGLGDINNFGTMELQSGGLNLSGNLENSGTVTFGGENVTSSDAFVNNTSASQLAVTSGTVQFGTVTNTAGTISIDADGTLSSGLVTVTANSMTNDGMLIGDLAVGSNATVTTTGTVTGSIVNDGTLVASGTVTGPISNSNTFTVDTAGLSGVTDFSQSAGALTLNVRALLETQTLSLAEDSTATLSERSQLAATSGTFTSSGHILAGSTFSTLGAIVTPATGGDNVMATLRSGTVANPGKLDNQGQITLATGELAVVGELENSGTLSFLNGTVTAENGIVNKAAEMDVQTPGIVTIGAGATVTADVTNAGILTNDGTISGDIVQTGGSFDNAGALGGALDIQGGTVDNTGTISGSTTIRSGATFITAPGTTSSVLAQPATGSPTNFAQNTQSTGSQLGPVTVEAGGTFINRGSALGSFVNSGTLDVEDQLTINGNFISEDGFVNFSTVTDELNITGDYSGDGTFSFATDLSGAPNGDVSRVNVQGNATGRIIVNLPRELNTGDAGLGEPLILMKSTTGNITYVEGTDNTALTDNLGGPVSFVVGNIDDTTIGIVSTANTGLASAVGGNLVLTQTVATTLVNRPSSPAVNGVFFEDDDNCSNGSWARLQGGQVEASASTFNPTLNESIRNTVDATYAGVQGGVDTGCYRTIDGGWDITGGLLFSVNTGSSSQTIFSPNPIQGEEPIATGKLDADFNQFSFGAYMAFARGDFFGDLQYRFDQTYFEFNDTTFNELSQGAGLDDTLVDSSAHSLSGSLSYLASIESLGISVTPTIGFAYTRTGGSDVPLTAGSELRAKPFDTEIGYLGAVVSKSTVSEDNASATSFFLGSTVYRDFASDRVSEFRAGTGTESLTSQNLGTFGEVSVGVGLLRLLGDGAFAGARQIEGGLRADYRFSDDVTSVGATGYIRFQF